MTYIDKLLLKLLTVLDTSTVPTREAQTLKSLGTSVDGQYFITENQSKLLLKLLESNHQHFGEMSSEILESISAPMWSRSFRIIEQVKKMYIKRIGEEYSAITIEFTFSANIRKILTQANRDIENLVQETNGKSYLADLTERNIVTLVELLHPLGFDIDQTIVDYYDTIKSWTLEGVRGNFLIDTMSSKNFHKHIADDLGINTAIDQNIIHDRSIRYRYFPTEKLEDDGTLTNLIAGRGRSKVWVDSAKYTLTEVVASLVELKRLPIMVVFDNQVTAMAAKQLNELSHAMEENNIDQNVGIYFRMQSNEAGAEFNEIIARNKYNQYLGPDTQVVGVQSGKIPKFLLTTNWRPMSVIALGTQLRSGKTAVYASCCDLIVTYTVAPPIIETQEKWQ
jgi:hypothetical protein